MLRVWLPLNGNLNNQGLDNASISNNLATVDSAGKIGSCYSFNGSNSYISVNDPGLYDVIQGGDQPFTIAFWIYHADSTRAIIFGDYGLSGTINFNIELSTSHYVRFYWNNGDPDKRFSISVGQATWTHIAVVYDGTKMVVYKNGDIQSDIYNGTLQKKTKTSGLFYLGRDSRTGTTALNGRINDFRIYDTVLSSREIKEISKALVLHYPLAMPGGENLLKNGSLSTDLSNWSRSDTSNMEIVEKDGVPAMHVSFSEFKITRYISQNITRYIDTSNLDQIYTVSADVLAENITKGTTNPMMTPCYVSGSYDDNGTSKWLGGTYLDGAPHSYCYGIAGKSWCHFVTRIKFAQVPTTMNFYCYFRDFTGDVWIRNLKFEIGDKATTWTPNPADPEYSIMGYDDLIEYDVSGYGNNGTKVGNITYNTDSPRYETSAYFNGSSDIRSAKSSFGWFDFNEGTVAAWYKPANTTQTWASVGVQNDGGAGSRSFSVCNYSGKAGTVVGYDSSWGYLGSNYSMDANVWYHLCVTITNGDTVKLYVNGELVQTRTVTNTTGTIASTTQFAVGVDLPGSDERYTGQLSDVRFYATALSADDIKALYQIPVSLSSDGTLFAGEYVEG